MPLGYMKIILSRIRETTRTPITLDENGRQATFYCRVCETTIRCALPEDGSKPGTWSDNNITRAHFLGNGQVRHCPVIAGLAGNAYTEAIEAVFE
jgi:hypothetical protein